MSHAYPFKWKRTIVFCLMCVACISTVRNINAAEKPYVVLDDKPKVIFYLSNSHKGTTGLQRHLDEAGFEHIRVHQILAGYLLTADPETGEWARGDEVVKQMNKARKEKYAGLPAVVVYQNNGPNIKLPKDRSEWPAARETMKNWATPTDGAYFAHLRKMIKTAGYEELYILNHHYSKTADRVDNPRWQETIKEYNRIAGHQLGIDCWETTKPFYPRTVGADYWHNNEFGRLAKTRPLMQAMARNSGIENYQQIDLPRALKEFEAGYRHVTNVTPVGRGQTYAIGESMDVTWRIDDADLFPYVNVYLEILGTTFKLKVGEHLVSATEHYRFQIPDTPLLADRGKSHPITSDKLRVRIAVDYGYEDHKQYGNAGLSSGVFTIVAKRTTEPAPSLLASVPTPLPDTLRMSAEMPWRIARWPGFYRGAMAIVVNDDDPELPGQLKVFAGREHPDLVSVVVDPREAESKTERWRAMDSLGHEIVFKHGVLDRSELERVFKSLSLTNTTRPITVGSDKTASLIVDNRPNEYRTVPEILDRRHSYHVKLGGEQTIRQAMDRVLTNRSLAILTFGSRGRDFEAQVNALHDRHGELWNGPFDRLVRYQVQARAAKLTVTDRPSKFELHLKLTDDLPDNVYHEPLFIQIPVPHWQWRAAKCRQNGEERWAALITAPRNHNVLRFSAVPDVGPIVLTRK